MNQAPTETAIGRQFYAADLQVQVTALLGTVLVAGAAASRSAANRKRAQVQCMGLWLVDWIALGCHVRYCGSFYMDDHFAWLPVWPEYLQSKVFFI